MITQFGFVLLFFISAILLVTIMLGVSYFMRLDKPNTEKNEIYESGEQSVGSANIAFNMRFYIVALIFILFDVELVVLFPWATIFGNEKLIVESNGQWALYAGIEMFIFVFILVLGLAYVWSHGHLEWIKPKETTKETKGVVPNDLYQKINERYQ